MSNSVSAYEAKTHLSALLDRAAAGETITITKHGHPVARLVPTAAPADLSALRARMRNLRDSLGPATVDVRALIEDGRRH